MNKPFDYSEVPFDFDKCAAEDCTKASTCLRHIALQHTPDSVAFVRMINPGHLKNMKGACKYYRPDTKIRYATGFMHTVEALPLGVADTFRNRMIAYLGRKNYYRKRRGETRLTPSEQKHIVNLAKELGVVLDEYFDGYIDAFNWKA